MSEDATKKSPLGEGESPPDTTGDEFSIAQTNALVPLLVMFALTALVIFWIIVSAEPVVPPEGAVANKAYRPTVELACHFHNTYGMALANCYAALRAGVRSFESSVAGLGGCPVTKIAGGNASTEDLVHMFQRMGIRTDLRLETLIEVARDVARFFNREMNGVV